jgi:hypothetical protein
MTSEQKFIDAFTEVAADEAAKVIAYWAVYFAPDDVTLEHGSGPLTVQFSVDVRAVKARVAYE